jgi:hypothetical protein
MTDRFTALTFPLQLAGTVVIEPEFGTLGACWNLTQENFNSHGPVYSATISCNRFSSSPEKNDSFSDYIQYTYRQPALQIRQPRNKSHKLRRYLSIIPPRPAVRERREESMGNGAQSIQYGVMKYIFT